jgi:hypothetical protein
MTTLLNSKAKHLRIMLVCITRRRCVVDRSEESMNQHKDFAVVVLQLLCAYAVMQ